MPPELREGAVVASRYRLDRYLGEGGFATVWAATHVVTRRRAALKFLKESHAADERARRRFLREARAVSSVPHPHVVVIHDVFEESGVPVMVMDLLEGESLGVRLERERVLSLADTAAIMLPVISALETAHAMGIVHRDLKPDNIFLARRSGDCPAEPDVKVLDFGIAKLMVREPESSQSVALTNSGAMLGTPVYMSPEQFFGDGDVDHRSDIWAIGVILYECLAGARPTDGKTVGSIAKAIVSESTVPLERRSPQLPADVTAVVTQALSFDCASRPTLREVRAVVAKYTEVKVPDSPRAPSTPAPAPAPAASNAPSAEKTKVVPPFRLDGRSKAGSEGTGKGGGRPSTPAPLTMAERGAGQVRRLRPGIIAGVAGLAILAAGLVTWRNTARPKPLGAQATELEPESTRRAPPPSGSTPESAALTTVLQATSPASLAASDASVALPEGRAHGESVAGKRPRIEPDRKPGVAPDAKNVAPASGSGAATPFDPGSVR